MSLERVGIFVTALLTVAVVILSVISYVQLSEVRQLQDELAIMQQASETENQGLHEELASLRAGMAELDASEDLATIQQSISRLRLQTLGVWVDDESFVSLQIPNIASSGMWEKSSDTVRTIRRSDYGSTWPFRTDDALLGCHDGEVLAFVNGNEFMVDSVSPGLHSFLNDIADISVFDPSSPELAAARERMIDEAQGLCDGRVVR